MAGVARLYNSPEFSDLTIRSKGHEWPEAQDNIVELYDDDPENVSRMLEWFYHHDYPVPELSDESLSATIHVRVFCLAEKYILTELKNISSSHFAACVQNAWGSEGLTQAMLELCGVPSFINESLRTHVMKAVVENSGILLANRNDDRRRLSFREALGKVVQISTEVDDIASPGEDGDDEELTDGDEEDDVFIIRCKEREWVIPVESHPFNSAIRLYEDDLDIVDLLVELIGTGDYDVRSQGSLSAPEIHARLAVMWHKYCNDSPGCKASEHFDKYTKDWDDRGYLKALQYVYNEDENSTEHLRFMIRDGVVAAAKDVFDLPRLIRETSMAGEFAVDAAYSLCERVFHYANRDV
ncbi:uncharacterized protein LTR77_009001 [Saxophila tyrrhenica]|uniref:BTB domain-containing protein n=1 Tax=Saxophila tyrrhenica TaxID=1690608 RepID=A0AAV9P372_9PEZI|nr:hypothetical protein LTR77_009001 [Saxophila tyrrhenica]